MTKKAQFIIKDKDGKVLEDFYSKNATKCFNSVEKGTPLNISIIEDTFAEQFVGPYIVKGLKGDTPVEPPIEPPVTPPTPPVEPPVTPPVEPPVVTPPAAGEVYNSRVHSKLHDGKVRTVKAEGSISPNGLGLECHASGNPRIQVNADKTFSLLCDAGHGRFYGMVLNYDATLEIKFAFWNQAPGQDLSLKMRSRHNEGGAEENRFGGYGVSVDRAGWNAKREDFHNVHSQSQSGSLAKIATKEYHTVRFTVRDEGNTVLQIGELDGKQFMKKVDTSPKAYMTAKASFAKQSYFWVRSNIDSGNGEIRIESLKVFKL